MKNKDSVYIIYADFVSVKGNRLFLRKPLTMILNDKATAEVSSNITNKTLSVVDRVINTLRSPIAKYTDPYLVASEFDKTLRDDVLKLHYLSAGKRKSFTDAAARYATVMQNAKLTQEEKESTYQYFTEKDADKIVDRFFNAKISNEDRHKKRVKKLDKI
jgi:hypothetical protein